MSTDLKELEKRMLNVCTFSMDNLRALIIVVCEYISTASAHCNPPSQQFESVMETQVKTQIQELIQKWIEKWGTAVDPKIAATATKSACADCRTAHRRRAASSL